MSKDEIMYTRNGFDIDSALQRLRELGPNWDTYGSREIQPEAINGAEDLLQLADDAGLPAPQLAPVGGGGVQLVWALPERALEIVIREDGRLEYVREAGNDMDDGSMASYRDPEAQAQLHWLAAGA